MAISKNEFKKLLNENKCPFCELKLEHYDGLLGYESMKCSTCNFEIDHSGIHI